MATANPGGRDGDTYLKVMIGMINEGQDKEEINLHLSHPLRLDDLSILSSENFMKILVYLLGDIIGKKPLTNEVKMTDFNKFGVGQLSYDCGPDQIYHAVKQLFGEGCEFFHYSVLLFPGKEPRRTKQILSYIMSFVYMCEQVHEQFSDCYEEMKKENEEKATICNEIDDLKERITDIIQRSEQDKRRLPILQRELQNIEEHIRKAQGKLSDLNKSWDDVRSKYEVGEGKIKKLEEKLGRLESASQELSEKIVSNPDEIKMEHARIQGEIESNTKKREELGVNLGKLQKLLDMFERVMVKVKETSKNFEVIVMAMQNAKTKMESAKSGNTISELARQIEQLKTEAEHLALRHSEKTKEAGTRVQQQQAQHHKLKKQIVELKSHIKDVIGQMYTEDSEMVKTRESISAMGEEVKCLQIELAQCMKDAMVTVPMEKEITDQEHLVRLGRIYRKFGQITGDMFNDHNDDFDD